MPRYWILCMSEDSYAIAKTQGLIDMAERQRRAIQKIATGDMRTFYITGITQLSSTGLALREPRSGPGN
jgi:hypothetical protein